MRKNEEKFDHISLVNKLNEELSIFITRFYQEYNGVLDEPAEKLLQQTMGSLRKKFIDEHGLDESRVSLLGNPSSVSECRLIDSRRVVRISGVDDHIAMSEYSRQSGQFPSLDQKNVGVLAMRTTENLNKAGYQEALVKSYIFFTLASYEDPLTIPTSGMNALARLLQIDASGMKGYLRNGIESLPASHQAHSEYPKLDVFISDTDFIAKKDLVRKLLTTQVVFFPDQSDKTIIIKDINGPETMQRIAEVVSM